MVAICVATPLGATRHTAPGTEPEKISPVPTQRLPVASNCMSVGTRGAAKLVNVPSDAPAELNRRTSWLSTCPTNTSPAALTAMPVTHNGNTTPFSSLVLVQGDRAADPMNGNAAVYGGD